MARITVGLDFGTHQTKICIENKEDTNNPTYTFFKFKRNDGTECYLLPSIVQIKEDDKLSYGFIQEEESKHGKKYNLATPPTYPILKKADLPLPERPVHPDWIDDEGNINISDCSPSQKIQAESYRNQLQIWKNDCSKIPDLNRKQDTEFEKTFYKERKDWFKWQNKIQTNYKLIYRYFKQSEFSDYRWTESMPSSYLCIWYLTYILFLLEEQYGNDFAIQMGIPTGAEKFAQKKIKAVSYLLSAYRLVEDVFGNNIQKFLDTSVKDLYDCTTIVKYSEEEKNKYSILIFPEAYASLKSLTSAHKIESGISLMADIGGGTTDITLFTILGNSPKIYHYCSIPFGINYILETASPELQNKFTDKHSLDELDENIKHKAIVQYQNQLLNTCIHIQDKLYNEFSYTPLPQNRLIGALENRPLIYSGGGSTYTDLQKPLLRFTDIKPINITAWEGMEITDINRITELCPILASAFGLAISEINDNVELASINEIFEHVMDAEEDNKPATWV